MSQQQVSSSGVILAGVSPEVDLASVLGLLEATLATGIFRAREGEEVGTPIYLRFFQGRIVKAIGGDVRDMFPKMLRSSDLRWTFKVVASTPPGDINEIVTSLLLGATTQLDHENRDVLN